MCYEFVFLTIQSKFSSVKYTLQFILKSLSEKVTGETDV